MAKSRLTVLPDGRGRLGLKRAGSDGTTAHVLMPEELVVPPGYAAPRWTRATRQGGAAREPVPGPRHGQDELPHRDAWQQALGPRQRAGGHPPAAARRTEPTPLAGERHEPVVVSRRAPQPGEAVCGVAAARAFQLILFLGSAVGAVASLVV